MQHSLPSPELLQTLTRLIASLEEDAPESDGPVFEGLLRDVRTVLGSPGGFCGHLDADGALLILASCSPRGGDAVAGPTLRIPPSGWEGVWGEVLRQRSPQWSNSPHRLPHLAAEVERSLGVPLLDAGQLVGMFCVANRAEDYTSVDALVLETLARPLAPVLQARFRRRRERHTPAEDDLALALNHEAAEASRLRLERELSEHLQAADRATKSLRQLEQTHRDILDATPAVIYVKGLDGRYEFINRRYEELFHVRRADLIGQTDFDVFPPDMAQAMQANDRRVAEAAAPLQFEEIAQHDDGPHTYFSVKFPLRDAAGQVVSIAGISTDVTATRKAEEDLEQLHHRHDLILDAIVDGVFGLDTQGRLTFMNPAASAMLGWQPEEILGRPMQDFIGTATSRLPTPCTWNRAQVSADEAVPIVVEDEQTLFRTKSGAELPVASVSRPLYVGGKLAGTVITFRDQSQERRAQQEAALRSELERERLETDYQLHAVRQIQVELFPRTLPTIPGFELAALNYPQGIVSGDFYDFIMQPDGSLVVVVGDACGHDLAAAVSMVEVHAALHTYLDCGLPWDRLIPRLNDMLCRHLSGRFVSLFIARLNPATGELEFAGAGHDARILRAGGKDEALRSTGIPLGLEKNAAQAGFQKSVLEPGDIALFLTDGFYEAQSPNRRSFGRKRVHETLRAVADLPTPEMIARLREAVCKHCAPFAPQDDMTAVLVRRLATESCRQRDP